MAGTESKMLKIFIVIGHRALYMIKIFRGVVDGEGGSSEGCLKWGGGGGGSLSDLSKNILKQGVGKGKSCS